MERIKPILEKLLKLRLNKNEKNELSYILAEEFAYFAPYSTEIQECEYIEKIPIPYFKSDTSSIPSGILYLNLHLKITSQVLKALKGPMLDAARLFAGDEIYLAYQENQESQELEEMQNFSNVFQSSLCQEGDSEKHSLSKKMSISDFLDPIKAKLTAMLEESISQERRDTQNRPPPRIYTVQSEEYRPYFNIDIKIYQKIFKRAINIFLTRLSFEHKTKNHQRSIQISELNSYLLNKYRAEEFSFKFIAHLLKILNKFRIIKDFREREFEFLRFSPVNSSDLEIMENSFNEEELRDFLYSWVIKVPDIPFSDYLGASLPNNDMRRAVAQLDMECWKDHLQQKGILIHSFSLNQPTSFELIEEHVDKSQVCVDLSHIISSRSVEELLFLKQILPSNIKQLIENNKDSWDPDKLIQKLFNSAPLSLEDYYHEDIGKFKTYLIDKLKSIDTPEIKKYITYLMKQFVIKIPNGYALLL